VSSSSLVTQRSHLAVKCPRTGDCLTFGFKFQAACDGCVIGAASKGVGFEALGIQPFSDTRHYRGQFVVPTAHLNYIQHALALLRNEFKAGKCWNRDNGGWSGSNPPEPTPLFLWALAVLRPHYGPDREPSAGIQVSMLAVLTFAGPNICWAGARFVRWSRRALDA